jgi:hypothetical protein
MGFEAFCSFSFKYGFTTPDAEDTEKRENLNLFLSLLRVLRASVVQLSSSGDGVADLRELFLVHRRDLFQLAHELLERLG